MGVSAGKSESRSQERAQSGSNRILIEKRVLAAREEAKKNNSHNVTLVNKTLQNPLKPKKEVANKWNCEECGRDF